MSLAGIKADLLDWQDEVPGQIGLAIVEYIAGLGDQAEMLTYRSFVSATGGNQPIGHLIAAVTILTSTRVSALDVRALFIDDDDEEYEIELDALDDALNRGLYTHPVTGVIVEQAEKKIVPFFVPSTRFRGDVE